MAAENQPPNNVPQTAPPHTPAPGTPNVKENNTSSPPLKAETSGKKKNGQQTSKPKNKGRRTGYTVILLLLLVGVITSCIAIYIVYQSPMSQRMTVMVPSIVPVQPTNKPFVANTIVPLKPTLQPTSTPVPGGICGATGDIMVLIGGIDRTEGNYLRGSDALRVMKADFSNKKVTILAFPRDLYISGPFINTLGYPGMKLGSLYDYVTRNAPASRENIDVVAVNYQAQVIFDQFGVISDHYITIDVKTYIKLMDTIGGVSVDIPADYREFRKGRQQLTGRQIFEYIRYPEPDESARIARQNTIINALREQMADPTFLFKTPALINQFRELAITDLSPQQILNLSCLMQMIPKESVRFAEIDKTLAPFDASGNMIPDMIKINPYLQELGYIEK